MVKLHRMRFIYNVLLRSFWCIKELSTIKITTCTGVYHVRERYPRNLKWLAISKGTWGTDFDTAFSLIHHVVSHVPLLSHFDPRFR